MNFLNFLGDIYGARSSRRIARTIDTNARPVLCVNTRWHRTAPSSSTGFGKMSSSFTRSRTLIAAAAAPPVTLND